MEPWTPYTHVFRALSRHNERHILATTKVLDLQAATVPVLLSKLPIATIAQDEHRNHVVSDIGIKHSPSCGCQIQSQICVLHIVPEMRSAYAPRSSSA